MMKVKCEKCGAEIGAEFINIQEMVAVCSRCNNISKIKDIAEEKESIEYEMPKGIEIREEFGELIIERRWYTPAALVLAFVCLFWDGISFTFFGSNIYQRPWIVMLFFSGYLTLGVIMTYICIATFINKTKIRVSDLDIEIINYPLPWGRKKILSSSDFRQFYTKEHISHTKNGVRVSYELYGISENGTRVKLLKGIESLEQVKYIEQQIEKYLKIDDEYVTEEKR